MAPSSTAFCLNSAAHLGDGVPMPASNPPLPASCGTEIDLSTGMGQIQIQGEYYARCRDRGMPHGKALKAVARKRLKVIYAVMRDKVPYVA